MAYPIPGVGVSTPYGKSGSSWKTCGWHTGVDFAAPLGTPIYAPIAGQVRHRNYGSSFGNHQFAISPDPGQPFGDGEVFFAHTTDRPSDGKYVNIGDVLAHVGTEGNSTGPHLHFEYHPQSKNSWGCGDVANPQVVLDHQSGSDSAPSGGYPTPTSNVIYLSKLHEGQRDSDSVWYWQYWLNHHVLEGGSTLPLTGNFLSETAHETILCQQQHGYGNDAPGSVYVGPSQAGHVLAEAGLTIVDDT